MTKGQLNTKAMDITNWELTDESWAEAKARLAKASAELAEILARCEARTANPSEKSED